MDIQRVDDADVERKARPKKWLHKLPAVTNEGFQQTQTKLLSANSCTGVTEWLVLTTSAAPGKKRDQESRVSTIDRLESPGETAS